METERKEKKCEEKNYNNKNIHQPFTKVLHITKTCGDYILIKHLQKKIKNIYISS